MNPLIHKRKLLPYGSPQEPVTAFIVANAATIATGAVIGAVGAAISGGNPLKGALMGAVFAGVTSAVSGAMSGAGEVLSNGAGATSGGASTLAPVSEATVMSVGGEAVTQAATQSVAGAATDAATQAATQGATQGATQAATQGIAAGNSAISSGLSADSALTGKYGDLLTDSVVPKAGISVTPANTAIGGGSGGGTGLLSKLGNALTSDKAAAAMVMTGGNALSGYARGKAEEEMYNAKLDNARYASPVGRGLLWSR